jgi:hypothetical protein
LWRIASGSRALRVSSLFQRFQQNGFFADRLRSKYQPDLLARNFRYGLELNTVETARQEINFFVRRLTEAADVIDLYIRCVSCCKPNVICDQTLKRVNLGYSFITGVRCKFVSDLVPSAPRYTVCGRVTWRANAQIEKMTIIDIAEMRSTLDSIRITIFAINNASGPAQMIKCREPHIEYGSDQLATNAIRIGRNRRSQ